MITALQRRCLRVIAEFIREHGYGPSHSEIMQAMGWRSKHNCTRVLDQLEARGYVRRWKGHSRSVEIIKPDPSLPPLPTDGRLVRSLLTVFLQLDEYQKQRAPDS